jgi:aerobic-type carbon monoxide dehydrogenase small subunit (CoxS/CutS family)
VLIDGRRINSCLTLAVVHEGDDIVTIEGLRAGPASCTVRKQPLSRVTPSGDRIRRLHIAP